MTELAPEKLNRILMRIGALIELKAKRLVPVDFGVLRASISFRIEGNTVIIEATAPYAEAMEYGTPPGILDKSETQGLEDWAKRHGVPFKPLKKKIEKQGIQVGTPEMPLETPSGYRPFLRTALYQSIPDIRRIVKEEMAK